MTLIIQAKTRQEVAAEYGINVRTLTRWLKKHQIDIPKRDRLLPKDIAQIYEKLGCPVVSYYGTKQPKMPDT